MLNKTSCNILFIRLRKIAKTFGARLHMSSTVELNGTYDYETSLICVSKVNTRAGIISTFFHELGHHVEYTSGKYKNYYNYRRSLKTQRRLALRAERSADKTGEQLCKKFYPNVRYERAYRTAHEIDYLRWDYSD